MDTFNQNKIKMITYRIEDESSIMTIHDFYVDMLIFIVTHKQTNVSTRISIHRDKLKGLLNLL